MTGFAVVGPNFRDSTDLSAMQSLSLVLMVSRIILLTQYTTVLWFARQRKDVIAPLVLKIMTLAVSAAVFLGLYFSFTPQNQLSGQIGWYVISVVEALSMLGISSYWTQLSFTYTCLSERVGLLTLIIIGEGIIGFTRTLGKIQGSFSSVSMVSGQAISAVLITVCITCSWIPRCPLTMTSSKVLPLPPILRPRRHRPL